jgi:lipoprotein
MIKKLFAAAAAVWLAGCAKPDPNKSTHYYAEAAELSAAWALRKQKGNKNTVWLDIGRISGSMGNDRIDIFVNVEGY